jgi:hypothetical protein
VIVIDGISDVKLIVTITGEIRNGNMIEKISGK